MPDAPETTLALVLPETAAASMEPQTIGDFPGRWTPGVPYAISALGLNEDEARRLLAAVPTPLVWTEVPIGEARDVFTRAEGSHAPSGYMEVELERAREATLEAVPVTTDQGDVVHVGHVKAERGLNPPWVDEQIDRDTLLSKGKSPDDARLKTVKRQIEDEVLGLKKPELDARAEALGLDTTLRKADLQQAVLDAEFAAADRPDEPTVTGVVQVQDPLDGTARPAEQETSEVTA